MFFAPIETSCSIDCSLSEDGFPEAGYSKSYTIESDNQEDGPLAALGDPRLPQPGDCWQWGNDEDQYVICNSAKAKRIGRTSGGGSLYECEYTFEEIKHPTEEKEPGETDDFTFDASYSEKNFPFLVDRNGKKVTNLVGDQYYPCPEINYAIPCFTISRTERKNPIAKCGGFQTVVNSGEFWGYPKGTLLATVSPNWDGTRWKVTYKIDYNPNGWQPTILERGFRVIDPDREEEVTGERPGTIAVLTGDQDNSGIPNKENVEVSQPGTVSNPNRLFTVLGDEGEPLEEPVLLARDGQRLSPGGNPVYTRYAAYEEIDFSIFNLPDLEATL